MSTDTPSEDPVPRDPSEYRLTLHAGQQLKHRDIPKPAIADTIKTGDIERTRDGLLRQFVKRYPGDDESIVVVVNVGKGEVVTVAWRE